MKRSEFIKLPLKERRKVLLAQLDKASKDAEYINEDGLILEQREALKNIKLTCLTETNAQTALARIIRFCTDAGIVEHLDELSEEVVTSK